MLSAVRRHNWGPEPAAVAPCPPIGIEPKVLAIRDVTFERVSLTSSAPCIFSPLLDLMGQSPLEIQSKTHH